MQRFRVTVTDAKGKTLLLHVTAQSIARAHRMALARHPKSANIRVAPAYRACVPDVATFAMH